MDVKSIPQFHVGKYFVDLYFTEKKVVVECDEHHEYYDRDNEIDREKYIKEILDCQFYRFRPHAEFFDISKVIYDLRMIFKN